jgi:hypothetical protein
MTPMSQGTPRLGPNEVDGPDESCTHARPASSSILHNKPFKSAETIRGYSLGLEQDMGLGQCTSRDDASQGKDLISSFTAGNH